MWQKLSTETRITKEPASGTLRSSASEAILPASVTRQRAMPTTARMAATKRMGPTTMKTLEDFIRIIVESGSLPPRESRSFCKRGSRKSTKKITTPMATTQMKSG